jgi:transposase
LDFTPFDGHNDKRVYFDKGDISMSRRQYTTEYKKRAVALSHEPGNTVAGVAKDLGIAENNLWRWREQYPLVDGKMGPKKGTLTPEQEEIRRLNRALADMTEERDILKKTIGIFSDRK